MKTKKILKITGISIASLLALWLIVCAIIALSSNLSFGNILSISLFMLGWSLIIYAGPVILVGMCIAGTVWFIKKYKSNKEAKTK